MAKNVRAAQAGGLPNIDVAADEVTDALLSASAIDVQYVKLMDGTVGGTTKAVVGANGLKVDPSGVTSPISAAVLPLPTGASTAAKQPALGVAGTPSTDVLTVQGIASMTPFKMVLYTSSNVEIDFTAKSPIAGSIASGVSATDAPVYVGGRAATANPTAVADGQVVASRLDKTGRTVTAPHQVRDLCLDANITLTSTTTAATLVAATASTFNDLISITLVNSSATGTVVQILNDDGTTVRWTGYCPPTDMRGIVFPVPLKQAAVNVTWKAKTVTSVASVTITAQYMANI